MSDNTEMLRNQFSMKVQQAFSPEEYENIMRAFDQTINDYEVQKKTTDLITLTDIPEMVKVFIASKHVKNLSFKTLKQYKYKLTNFFNDVKKPYNMINATDVRLYLDRYKTNNKVSNRTLENTRIIINTFFEWCSNNDYLPKNPIINVEHIKYQENVREPLSDTELETLRWNCNDVREKALIDFFFSTGMRVSECSDVLLKDIDWQNRMVIIQHGKGDKRRFTFFNAEAEVSLKKYLETRTDDDENLFVSLKYPHTKLSTRALEIAIKKVGQRCGINVFPHKLRHTFGTFGLNSGMPIDRLQALMGHVSPRTTLIYAKHDTSDLQREHKKSFH